MLWVRRNIGWPSVLFCAFLLFASAFALSEQFTKADREFAQEMLKKVAEDIPKYYYDSKLHGLDWDAKVREAKKNIETADSLNGAVSEIAALLDSLNDSHTSFYPPSSPQRIRLRIQYGDDWRALFCHSRSSR